MDNSYLEPGAKVQVNQPFHTATTRADLAVKWKLVNWQERRQAPLMKPGILKVVDHREGTSGLAAIEIEGLTYIVSLSVLALIDEAEGWVRVESLAGKKIVNLPTLTDAQKDAYCKTFGYYEEPVFNSAYVKALQRINEGAYWNAFVALGMVREIEAFVTIGQFIEHKDLVYILTVMFDREGTKRVVAVCLNDGHHWCQGFVPACGTERISVSEVVKHFGGEVEFLSALELMDVIDHTERVEERYKSVSLDV